MTQKSASRRSGAAALVVLTATALVLVGGVATAAIVPTVVLGTSANYAVLGGSTVTNTGNSVLNGSLGLSPGTSITGFPPGTVAGSVDNANGAAAQAQSDLTAAYIDAASRVLNGSTTADLGNLVLVGGVYAGPSNSALSLTGNLTLDGAGDPNSVFIFQTGSTLTTASGSSVSLINGAQECNVFWQVGSSATLGTNSVFAGNILALQSITVTTGVTVRGRALARNGAVTLDTDTFIAPTCNLSVPTTTTIPGATTTAVGATTTAVGATTTAVGGATTAPITGLPFTGLPMGTTLLAALSSLVLGAALLRRGKTLKD
ncbi:MAG TPA: ice-binding family protein [Acidimicrobiia bacterium]|nr:ice-binding family protein [Acidimicrobiia bacterium]